nr:glycosyltransferase family 4 protein [Tetrasphaera sp. HKS02]
MRQYLDQHGTPSTLVTPFDWGGLLRYPVFGARRLALDWWSRPAGVLWYRFWHEEFLRRALRRLLASQGDCVVYAQDPLAAAAALRARHGPHQRVVLAVHFRISNADEYADSSELARGGRAFRAVREFERRTIPRTDGLVYVSQWGQEALVGWLPEAADVPAAVIGNFVEPLPPTADQEPLGDLVTTGRLEPAKNHRYLLEVVAEAKRQGRLFSLDIFGEGPSRDELVRQAGALGVDGQVRFRGFQRDVRTSLPRYRAYVHASYSESLPLAIIEAMAAGLPIVAGDTGGINELCDDGIEARFWPLDDPARAAETLIALMDSEPARRKAALAAHERFGRDFDAAVVAPKLIAFLGASAAIR